MDIIREPKRDGTPPLKHQRALRHCEQLIHHIERGQFKQAEQCIFEYQKTRPEFEAEMEEWTNRVDGLITEPPYLFPNEPQFLNNMIGRLHRDALPTGKQASWIKKIERRRRW